MKRIGFLHTIVSVLMVGALICSCSNKPASSDIDSLSEPEYISSEESQKEESDIDKSSSSKKEQGTTTSKTPEKKPTSSKEPNNDSSEFEYEPDDEDTNPPLHPTPVTINGKEWIMTFRDEFNGQFLDPTKWTGFEPHQRDDCMWGIGDNAIVSDGELKLLVTGSEKPYLAGAIRSRGLFEQAYGYFEIRCRLPKHPGINTAFWLFCDGAGAVGTPGGQDGTEIDIFESQGYLREEIQHALHWDGYGAEHKTTHHVMYMPGIYQGYHTFGFEWTENSYVFYVDGVETWRSTGGGICEMPTYLKLTSCVGGWVGEANPIFFPTDALAVDYVRVYKEAK